MNKLKDKEKKLQKTYKNQNQTFKYNQIFLDPIEKNRQRELNNGKNKK